MPLYLLKNQGEEEFLVFGCTESNQGRKVAEVEFAYSQVSAIKVIICLCSHQMKEEGIAYNTQLKYKITTQSKDFNYLEKA